MPSSRPRRSAAVSNCASAVLRASEAGSACGSLTTMHRLESHYRRHEGGGAAVVSLMPRLAQHWRLACPSPGVPRNDLFLFPWFEMFFFPPPPPRGKNGGHPPPPPPRGPAAPFRGETG